MSTNDSHREKKQRPVVLGQRAFRAISAVEGLRLSAQGEKRVYRDASIEERRADVIRAYADAKRAR